MDLSVLIVDDKFTNDTIQEYMNRKLQQKLEFEHKPLHFT